VYRFESTFAGSVVLDAVDATWSAALARGLTMEPRLGAAQGALWADAPLLTRALVNLLNNAIRHSPRGGTIHVCVETDAESSLPYGEVLISVQDEGSGMDAGTLQALMTHEGGRRKPGADPEAGHGWGMGLTIVRTVIARHGGWLDVVSAPDAGTTFLIGLPLSPDDVQYDPTSGGREP
jgi:signal transduction histidine kinase